jgi:hypothetical protein
VAGPHDRRPREHLEAALDETCAKVIREGDGMRQDPLKADALQIIERRPEQVHFAEGSNRNSSIDGNRVFVRQCERRSV